MNPETERDAFLERVVKLSPSIGARLTKDEGIYSGAPGKEEENRFVASLKPEQRATLARILIQERSAAIFDMLVQLQDTIAVHGWTIQKDGVQISPDRDDYTLFQDYLDKLKA